VLIIAFFFCSTQLLISQEDGVVSLELLVRNSLRFNRYALNPTFSFVREQNKYISFTNKRQWVQFDNAPLTYVASYSGRFRENIGVGVSLFQQNYGVLTSFGGILNFAYNARIQRDNNLTFGLNLGFYNSGINEGEVITNAPDPSLNNIPSNFLLSISPGINYGTMFFDFGVSVNNLVQYNLKTSALIEEDPQQSIQAHIMYTGYMDARGFLDESKFSTLVRSEFKKDITIVSGIAMLTVPKGIWGQVGYNSLYGFSGGVGLNITKQIAIEYNFEKAVGDLTTFGPSHEITLAYKFKNKENYYYSGNDEELAFVIPEKRKRVLAKPTESPEVRAKRKQEREAATAQAKADKEAQLEAERVAKIKAVEDAKLASELEAKKIKEEEVQSSEAAAKAKADEEARIAAEKLKEIELIAKAKEEEEAKQAAEVAAKAKADEEARIAAEKLKEIELIAKAKEEEELKQTAELAAKAKADEEARIAEEKLKEIEIKAQADKKARIEAEEAVKLEITHKDDLAKAMFELTQLAKQSKQKQEDLITRLNEAVEVKNNDLKDLKEENDLSEQGIYKAPKAFKSVTAENRALEALKTEVDNAIIERDQNIIELEKKYSDRLKTNSNENDATNQYYRTTIQQLKEEQRESVRAKATLVSRLEKIDIDLEFERNRRIKRALYDNEEDRYQKDRIKLNQIKQSTDIGANRLLKEEDFDFGEERILDNIQIVKDVKNIDEGYYVVLAVHNDSDKRDEFLTKAISAGEANIDFFYDVNSSKYFIYYEKHNNIEAARKAIQNNDGQPYNSKMSIVKIEK